MWEQHQDRGVKYSPMSPVEGVELIGQADITRAGTQAEIKRRLGNRRFNAIVSDMAPDATGTYAMDHERIVALVRTVFRLFADPSPALPLIENGKFLCKLWDGPRRAEFMKDLQAHFRSVKVVKPDASREHSAELYLFANGFISPVPSLVYGMVSKLQSIDGVSHLVCFAMSY
ncbi:ribosomal RNA methyltransferase [Aphelenchoides avenae]|nr:ribosomal RNA methyltransferase [Aphelenchus avenae]